VANKLPAFLDGARLVVKIDGVPFAFCEAISFSDNMASQLTMGLGSYGPHTNEPMVYSAQASLRVLRYTRAALGDNALGTPSMKSKIPVVKDAKGFQGGKASDGNSMMMLNSFSPLKMLLESTFDIEVYTRTGTGNSLSTPTYVMEDCLITDLSIRFNVGALVSEDVSILCRIIKDVDERITKV